MKLERSPKENNYAASVLFTAPHLGDDDNHHSDDEMIFDDGNDCFERAAELEDDDDLYTNESGIPSHKPFTLAQSPMKSYNRGAPMSFYQQEEVKSDP
jgi:hypothetical protein